MSLWPPSLCQPFPKWMAWAIAKVRKLSQLDSGWQDWPRIQRSTVEILSAAAVRTKGSQWLCPSYWRVLWSFLLLWFCHHPQIFSWWSDWLFLSYIRGSYLLFWVILVPKRARPLEAPCFSFWWLTLRQLRVWVFCCAAFLKGKLEGKCVAAVQGWGVLEDTADIKLVLLCY